MELILTERASVDFEYWKKSGNNQVKKKIEKLLTELQLHPFSGSGKPEPLKNNLAGLYSRHLSKKDRLVYEVVEDKSWVVIHSMKGHYSDK
ncbi:MAG: Txe/YoeB family addiction module toxin [Bacteroidales bacterium]|nr:Txe/YoeB family addiction module toxin [Bacteroidales bacterium]